MEAPFRGLQNLEQFKRNYFGNSLKNGNNCTNTSTSLPSESKEISNLRRALPQFLAVSAKNILLFVYGMTLGFPTIVIPAIQGGEGREPSDIVLNRDQISWFSSINLICVPLGCIFSEHLYAALCLSGLGGGLMEAPVLTYVAEITEPKYRGILSALGSTCVITGIFIQFIMGSLMDWRTIAAISAAFPIFSIIALCFVPESPIWLIRAQRFREALKSLQWLRGWVTEHDVKEEFNRLYDELITQPALEEAKESMDHKTHGYLNRLRMFKKRSFLVPFLLVAYTFFTGHFSGKTSLQTYAVQIFHTLKAPINKYHATILLGVAEMIATIMCVFLIHFTGKRPLVLISTVGVGICFFGTATYAYHLKVIPGFAINNVVVNASSLVPNENILSHDNITKIFENQGNSEPAFSDKIKSNKTQRELPRQNTTFGYHENESNADLNDTIVVMYTTTISPNLISTTNKGLPNAMDPKDIENNILLTLPQQEQNKLVWLPLILLLGAAFFAHFGIRMIPWILIGEVFPAPVRSTASGLVSGLGYIFGFLANKLFLQMLGALTLPGTFWFYSLVALVGAVILYFTLPETEGRTLGEIEAHFSKKSTINLLSKKQQKQFKENDQKKEKLETQQFQKRPSISKPILMGNASIPINSSKETNIIQLQQCEPMPPEHRPTSGIEVTSSNGVGLGNKGFTNLAYEKSDTTHL
uniref:Major facilitator superfamily (MFS) profile domain-containing protein n=1 Tax=Glossina morsitans morsitans TaxID=37546 RepID=A0A1B0G9I1_GLOMM